LTGGAARDHRVVTDRTLTTTTWRPDIDSLSFQPRYHAGQCIVHRRAFATILGFEPTPDDCATCFQQHLPAFEAAAAAKITSAALAADANFHLTSRDILRVTAARR
jgi:hypothetical protein